MDFDFDYKRKLECNFGFIFHKIMAKIAKSTILKSFFIIFDVSNIGMLIWILIVLREYILRDKKFLGTLYIEKLLIVNYKDYESLEDFTAFGLLPWVHRTEALLWRLTTRE